MRWLPCTALALALLGASPAGALFLPGEGENRNECWIGFSVDGRKPLDLGRQRRGSRVVQESCAGACDFSAHVCLNNPGCEPASLTNVHILGPVLLDRPKAATPVESCGKSRSVTIPLGRGGRATRRKLVLMARADAPARGDDVDVVTLVCRPAPKGDTCARCGDGDLGERETCDDGNGVDGDGCDRNCTPTGCGNGVRTMGEACDDGNGVDGDGCDDNCTPTGCGNGVVTANEECDPPGLEVGLAVCNKDCELEPNGPCTCPSPPTRLVTTTRTVADACGDAVNDSGQSFSTLTCGGLYIGGGDATVQQPIPVPEGTEAAFGVARCNGNRFILGQTTPETAGAPNRCTATGCRFGPPLPAPNTLSASLSVCIMNTISRAVGGEAECDTGRVEATIPLVSHVFLTGEDQAPADPGLQACPVCVEGRCRGGANQGGACTPWSPTIATSYDCPPSGEALEELSLDLAFSTEPITWTAVPSGNQSRVFCGYCRDADSTLAFADPPIPCVIGARATSSCGVPFESCEQRQQGAFGPNGGGVATITLRGAAGGPLAVGAPVDATLASVFCVPPVASDVVNNNVSLPGPAALTLPVRITPE